MENFDSVCVRKDGRRLDVSLTVSPILDKTGQLIGISTIAHDISQRKRTEEALRQSQEVSLKAKQAAEEANNAKTLFLANVSHELRTPINEILGMAEATIDSGVTFMQKEYQLNIQSSAQGLLHLVTQLQDITRSEIGDLSIEPVPFQLREMLGQTLRPFIAQAEQVGLELRWKIDPAVPECVIGDSTRLRQILVNLLGNAVKFTEQGTIRLNVMCVSRKNDQTELQFNVADTGIGIPAHRHASIFEPFTAARGGSKRTHSGPVWAWQFVPD